jgi:hypothetical protein
MRLDIRKIDDRINKLQEVRRIASDPEMIAVLAEFLTSEEESREPLSEPKPAIQSPVIAKTEQVPDNSDVEDIVRGIFDSHGPQAPGNAAPSGMFQRKRA